MKKSVIKFPLDWLNSPVTINKDRFFFSRKKGEDELVFETKDKKYSTRLKADEVPYYLGENNFTPELIKSFEEKEPLEKSRLETYLASLENFQKGRDDGLTDEELYDRYNEVIKAKSWINNHNFNKNERAQQCAN